MQRNIWRSLACVAALLLALSWGIGSGWWVSQSWPLRGAMARIELAREEVQCANRSASSANQQRCRDMAEIMSKADMAEAYFIDGAVVLGPSLILLGLAIWLWRGLDPGDRRRHDRPHHDHHPSAA